MTGHRDGIYFEFVKNTEVRDNLSERNLRYGLHFMQSDDCRYFRNVFRNNLGGVAVMYSRRVTMVGNRFEDNWGPAAYGLLLKEVSDARLENNVFSRNTMALFADGANHLGAVHNEVPRQRLRSRVLSNTGDGRFERNGLPTTRSTWP